MAKEIYLCCFVCSMLVVDLDILDWEMLLVYRVCTLLLLYTCTSKGVRGPVVPLMGDQGLHPHKKLLGFLLANNLRAHGIGWLVVFSQGNSPIKGKHCNMVVYCSIVKTISVIVWESEDEVQRVWCRLYPFIFVERYNNKRNGNFCVDVAHIGWTMLYMCLSCNVF